MSAGGYFKPYVNNGQLYIDYIAQTDCKPLKFDNAGNVTSIAFSSQITKGDRVYTRLETHTYNKPNYTIDNKVYVADVNSSYGIGRRASLSDVEEWSQLSEHVTLMNIEKPLFAYYKVPMANNIDTKSCIGVSVYNKAIDSIRRADVQASRLDYEYESAERSIYADVTALKDEGGRTRKLKMVKTLDTGEDGFYKEFSPQVRDEGFIRGLNKIKQEIEFQCSLSYGTISDPNLIEKTATEINASKQRSYSAVSKMQTSLQNALEHLLYIIDIYATLYELAPAGIYETSYEWDDSIIVDPETEQRIRIQETNLGLGSKLDYLMWRYGLTEQQAQEKLARIKLEKSETELFGEE